MSEPYILVVEDEEPISLLIKYNLEKEGFLVKQAFDGQKALDLIEEKIPDLLILDWMLPEISGIELCKEIRDLEYTKTLPILMLTARSQEEDKLKGFSSGADDYMTKPFSPKELVARIRSILKRAKPTLVEKETAYGGIIIDNNRKSAVINHQRLELSPTEFALMQYLVERPEKVHSRDMLLRQVWKEEADFIESRTVDVCVRRLRSALEKVSPGLENMIKTVRGEGYILEKN